MSEGCEKGSKGSPLENQWLVIKYFLPVSEMFVYLQSKINKLLV